MTAQEVLSIFDLQYNNISSDAAPGLNSYEVSVYLTKAHKEIVNSYYNGNAKGDSIESKEKVRSLLSRYIKDDEVDIVNPVLDINTHLMKAEITLTSDTWQILMETLKLDNRGILVKPEAYDRLMVISEDPFKLPDAYKAWRLDTRGKQSHNTTLYDRVVTVFFSPEVTPIKYSYTYLSIPEPIVLSNFKEEFGEELSIQGISTINIPATINDFLWDIIINRAVELAVRDYKENTLQTQVITNQRPE